MLRGSLLESCLNPIVSDPILATSFGKIHFGSFAYLIRFRSKQALSLSKGRSNKLM